MLNSLELLQHLCDAHVDGRVGLVERDLLVFGLLVAVVLLEPGVALCDDLLTHALLIARRELIAAQSLQEVGVTDVTFALAVVPASTQSSRLKTSPVKYF